MFLVKSPPKFKNCVCFGDELRRVVGAQDVAHVRLVEDGAADVHSAQAGENARREEPGLRFWAALGSSKTRNFISVMICDRISRSER